MADFVRIRPPGPRGTFEHFLLDQVPAAVIATDLDGVVTHWNREAEVLYGWTRDEAVGRDVRDLTVNEPDEAEQIMATVRQGAAWRGETTVRRKDGTTFPAFVTLSATYDELDRLAGVVGVSVDISERKRAERRLGVQHAVARALSESETIEEAARRILQEVAETLGWQAALLWTLDADDEVLRLVDAWHLPGADLGGFVEASKGIRFTRGNGLPGRVWEHGAPIWLPDFGADSTLPRATIANASGLHGAFGAPIRLGRQILGVIEFFSRQEEAPDDELVRTMSSIGSQIGQFVERTEAVDEMRRSEARKAAVLASALDAVVSMDHQGLVSEFNPAAETVFGYRREDVVGKPMAELLVPPDLRSRHLAGVARYLETGLPRILGRRVELEGMRSDGTVFPVELSITRIDAPGPPAFTAYIRDITERRSAEEQVRQAEARYRTLVENTPVVSYTNEIEPSRCVYISPQVEALTGYTAEEWMAEPGLWQSVLHPADRMREIAKDAEHNASGEPYHSEYRIVTKDGREVWVRDDAVILPDEAGRPALWQGVMVDVTDRKVTELQLRARALQQETVADLGRMALTELDVGLLMDRAVRMACRTLGVEHCQLLEMRPGMQAYWRAGLGWREGYVGSTVDAGPDTLAGYTISLGEPVVVDDLARETRFTNTGRLREHGLVSGMSVLIRGHERPWGILGAFSTERREFPPDDVYFLRALANVLAMAIERRRVEKEREDLLASEQLARTEAERARERLRFLAESSSVLSSSLDFETTLSRLARIAVPELADWCVVYRLDEKGMMPRVTVASSDPRRAGSAEELRSGVALNPQAEEGVPKVIRSGQPLLFPEATPAMVGADTEDPADGERLAEELGVRSWMVVPLSARGRTIGAMSFLQAESGRRFGEDDLSLAMELARHAALAVDNSYLYEAELEARRATERAAQRTALLQAVTAALSEALGPAEVAQVVVDRCVGAMGAAAGLVALVLPETDELEIIRAVGYRPEIAVEWARWPVSAPTPLSDAVRTREPVFLTSREDRDERYPTFADAPMSNESAAAVPLVVEGRAIGGMALSFAEPREFSVEDRAFMLALARQCAQALERSRLYQSERTARAEAELANARLAFLAEASEILARSLDFHETLAEVTRLVVPRLADWCAVDMLEEGEIVRVSVAHVDPAKVQLAWDLQEQFPTKVDDPTGVPNVIRTGEPELWPEITEQMIVEAVEDPGLRQLVVDLQLRSLMIVPLKFRGRTLGAITFVWAESGRTYGPPDLALAQDLARRCAQAVENSLVYRERDYIAQTLQRSLLPPDLPEIPGLELAARYLPAGAGNEVGGDFYDVFDTGDEAWGLAIGDVCGKGPDAAAVMGVARYSLRAAAMRERRPSQILQTMNEAVMRQTTDGRFLTVAYARIRPNAGGVRMTISCGGHPLPMVLRADGTMETAGAPGTLLGLFEDPELADKSVDLEPGDTLIVYTDGVTDAPGFEEGSGERRLSEVLATCVGLAAEEVADRIEREMLAPRASSRRDDVAYVVLRVRP